MIQDMKKVARILQFTLAQMPYLYKIAFLLKTANLLSFLSLFVYISTSNEKVRFYILSRMRHMFRISVRTG